jgi:TorA maturation chaperone TorD
MARVQEVRTRMLAAADSMYRRWLAKLFPLEPQAVVVEEEVGVRVMYRRWLAKLFPLEPQAVLVNNSGSEEVESAVNDQSLLAASNE